MSLPTSLTASLSLPLIGAPMFIVSQPDLVLAQCQQGIIGAFPALNARPVAQLDQWLTQINSTLEQARRANPEKPIAPFAVNQIVHRSNTRLSEDVDLCVKHRVPIIISSLMAPTALIDPIHSYGGLIFHDVTNVYHAKKAIDAGVDGLILVCAGAGGHAGQLSPFALLSEIRAFYQGTVILSGAMSSGADILAAQALGADLAYMGTRFIATTEACASQAYKDMLVTCCAEDIVYSSLFTGVHGNYLKPSIAAAGLDPERLQAGDKSTMDFSSGSDLSQKAWRDIWGAGQGLGAIKDVPSVAELAGRLRDEYRVALQQVSSLVRNR